MAKRKGKGDDDLSGSDIEEANMDPRSRFLPLSTGGESLGSERVDRINQKLPAFDGEEEEEMRGTYIVGKNKRCLYDFAIKSVVFKSESGPSEKDKLTAVTAFGDDMN